MKSIKSFFISIYFLFLVISFLFLGYHIMSGELAEIYFFAAFLSSMGPILYFLFLYLKRPKEVSFLTILIFTFCGVSTLIAIGYYFTEGSEMRFPMLFALGNFAGWIIYYVWYTHSIIKSTDAIENEIKDSNTIQSLLKENGSKHTLVLYINNKYYPFGIRQHLDFVKAIEEIKSADTELVFISSDINGLKNSNPSIKLVDNSKGEYTLGTSISVPDKAPFFLGQKISNKYCALPLVILSDKNGKIRFVHASSDDRKRPNPGVFLRIIREF